MRNSKCSGCNEPLWVDISDTSYNGSMRRLSTSWKAQREGAGWSTRVTIRVC